MDIKFPPKKSKKYVVKTVTTLGNTNTFEAYYNVETKRFNVSNQVVVKWLNE